MEKITSAQNSLIKKLVKVASLQSFRRKSGLTILDGAHLTAEYLVRVGAPLVCAVAEGLKSPEVESIVQKSCTSGARVVEVSKSLFSKISPVVDGVGILFLVETPASKGEISPDAETLILEDIQDPGNLGTILRSAAAFGVEQIICSGGTVSVWSPKVLRAGMGAHFGLKIFENQDLGEVVSKLEVTVLATSLEASKSIYEEDLSGVKAWVFGNEGKGVSKELQAVADKKVIIPQASSVESLNVAMAATVCLAESHRQKITLR